MLRSLPNAEAGGERGHPGGEGVVGAPGRATQDDNDNDEGGDTHHTHTSSHTFTLALSDTHTLILSTAHKHRAPSDV